MIAIRIGTEFLELQDTKIRIRMESPLFSADIIAPAFSYPISLPRTPTNTRLLNHADQISRTATSPRIDCVVYIGGLPWREAIIHFRRFRNGRFDVDLSISKNIDIARFTNRRLRSFDMGSHPIRVAYAGDADVQLDAYNTLFTSYTGVIGSTRAVYAPFWDENQIGGQLNFFGAFEDTPLDDVNRPGGLVNKYRGTIETTRPWVYYTEADPIIYWVHLMVPMTYLALAVEEIFAQLGYTFTSDIMEHKEVRRMVIFSNAVHSFYVGTNTGGPGVSTTDLRGGDLGEFELAQTLPDMSLIEFMLALQKRFNGRFIFDTSTTLRFISLKSLLRASNKRDITNIIDPEPDFDTADSDGFTLEAPSDDLESMEQGASDAITSGTFDNTTLSLPELEAITPDDGETGIILNSNEVYFGRDGVWLRNADYRPETIVGEGGTTIDVGVALTRMAHFERPEAGGDYMIVPRIEMSLSTTEYDPHRVGIHDITTLRLLFYRGMQGYSIGEDKYPLLTTGIHDAAGAVITGATHTERLEGDGGILNVWYTEWLEFLANMRIAKKRVRMGPEIIHSFQWDEKMHANGTDYLVKSVDVEFTATSMGLPTLEMVRIPPFNSVSST